MGFLVFRAFSNQSEFLDTNFREFSTVIRKSSGERGKRKNKPTRFPCEEKGRKWKNRTQTFAELFRVVLEHTARSSRAHLFS